MKRVICLMLLVFFVLTMINFSWAEMGMCGNKMHLAQAKTEEPVTEVTTVEETIDVGNKICPVSGEKIKEEKKYQVEHEGKIYNLCCKACVKDFKKDPEKYIKKVNEELQAKSKGQSEHEGHGMEMMQESETSHQGAHQSHHH